MNINLSTSVLVETVKAIRMRYLVVLCLLIMMSWPTTIVCQPGSEEAIPEIQYNEEDQSTTLSPFWVLKLVDKVQRLQDALVYESRYADQTDSLILIKGELINKMKDVMISQSEEINSQNDQIWTFKQNIENLQRHQVVKDSIQLSSFTKLRDDGRSKDKEIVKLNTKVKLSKVTKWLERIGWVALIVLIAR